MHKVLGMDELSEEELCTRIKRKKVQQSSAAETDAVVTDGSEQQSGQTDPQDDECTYHNSFYR